MSNESYYPPSAQPPRKRQRSHSGSGNQSTASTSSAEFLLRQIHTVNNLFQLEEQLLALFRVGSFPQLQERAKAALVRAVLACPDKPLVDSVELTFHTYELWCFSRSIPQYPVTGLKVAVFLSQHLGLQANAAQVPRATIPPSYLQELAFLPGQRACLSVMSQWLRDLQSCCAATSACFGSSGDFVSVENLGGNIGVRLVLEEARKVEADELRRQLRGESVHHISWVGGTRGVISQSLFGPSPRLAPRVNGTRVDASREGELQTRQIYLPSLATILTTDNSFSRRPFYGHIDTNKLPPIPNHHFLRRPGVPQGMVTTVPPTPQSPSHPTEASMAASTILHIEFRPSTSGIHSPTSSAVPRMSPSPAVAPPLRRLTPIPNIDSPELLSLPPPASNSDFKGPVGFMSLLNR